MKTLGPLFFGIWMFITPIPLSASSEPGMYQVVITEIMADPDPPVGLPVAEYIELFNRGGSGVSLAGCRIVFGKTQKLLPAFVEPYSFVIVCDASDESRFTPFGKTIPIDNLPPVLNSGMAITLKSCSGNEICSVEFTNRWYRSVNKVRGGWSLEMIDPDNVCGGRDNWIESRDPHGGTPGAMNSVNAVNSDRQKPKLLRATLGPDYSVLLHFSESMDTTSLTDPANFSASPELFHPAAIDPVEPGYTITGINFGARIKAGIIYTLTSLNTLKDCAGNSLDFNARADFGIPQPSDSFDVVINELLYDARSDMAEFLELYNRSEKIIDLAEFSLALYDPGSDTVVRQTGLKNNPFLLFPGHYVAITRQADILYNPVVRPDPSDIVENPALFIFPDRDGKIALLNSSCKIIDCFNYSPRMHSQFLSDAEGVSLERINANEPTDDPGNWNSASSVSGYCTPGYENSQAISPAKDKSRIVVSPQLFSPDADGVDDAAVITLQPGEPGFIGNVLIFNMQGMLIRSLAENMLMGTETILSWDGLSNDRKDADIGIYLIYIELFNQKGNFKKYRKVVTLARKL